MPPPPDAAAVGNAMIKAGLPATIALVYTGDNDPNHLLGRQGGYSSKVSMQDKRLPAGDLSSSSTAGGASIECYPDQAGAAQRYAYLHALTGNVIGDGYDYLSGDCVLRLDNKLNPTEATGYDQLFKAASPS